MEYRPGEDHTIERPASYEHWRTHVDPFWPGPQLSWEDVEPITLARRTRPIFDGDTDAARVEDLWHYRRILARTQFEPGHLEHDVSLVNWPQIDYWAKPILGVEPAEQDAALAEARELSLSFLYWMQTEAPRHDGGTGYPGLRPRGDLLDSDDLLAIAPYVRESRRIRARFTVTEAHIGREMRGEHAGSEVFADSVGLGYYRIDLHPSASGRSYVDIACFPFQIPLGALVPVRVRNLLPANKNIGTTHITNGAYRLHPVEWSIGEAVGALAARCRATRATPQDVWSDPAAVRDLQEVLTARLGLTLAWPEDIRTGAAVQDHVPVEDTDLDQRVAR
nr:FAD-dependent oxidoreductase [Jiangella alba]